MRTALRSWSSIVPASPGCMNAWPPMATSTIGCGSITAQNLRARRGQRLLGAEHLEDAPLRERQRLLLLLPAPRLRLVGRRRLRVAVEDAGVELAPVLRGQRHRLQAVARVVAQAGQGLHAGLVCLELLVLLAVGDARRLHVDEGEAGVADGLLDRGGQALHVRRRALRHEA